MAAITSSLMISQQALKKAPVKPSGPGALSEGMEYIVFLSHHGRKAPPNRRDHVDCSQWIAN